MHAITDSCIHVFHKTCKNFREVRFGIGFLLHKILFAKFRSHINPKEGKKWEIRYFHKRPVVLLPSEKSFAYIPSASHNPTVSPWPPVKSARITYDTISCNDETTKEFGNLKDILLQTPPKVMLQNLEKTKYFSTAAQGSKYTHGWQIYSEMSRPVWNQKVYDSVFNMLYND